MRRIFWHLCRFLVPKVSEIWPRKTVQGLIEHPAYCAVPDWKSTAIDYGRSRWIVPGKSAETLPRNASPGAILDKAAGHRQASCLLNKPSHGKLKY
jgi:hypothetical protein